VEVRQVSALRKLRIGTAVAAAIATMLVGPTVASAGPVEDLVNQVSNGVNQTLDGLLGGGQNKPDRKPAPDTQGGEGESFYVPPAHGTNPHGQGTVGVIDDSLLTPDPETNPFPYEAGGANETVVIGRSRGEQNDDGTYHGHVTLISLLGTEIPLADTNEGDSAGGPLGDLNDALADLCIDTGFICLEVLDVDSETDASGSENSFDLVSAGVFLAPGLSAFISGGSSSGEISEANGCQTATGESTVGEVELPIFALAAGHSESQSQACNDGTSTQENESSALLFDLDLLRTLDLNADCENGVPDTEFLNILVIAAICNADDSSNVGGTQLDTPFGVREAFTLFIVDFLDLGGGFEEGPAVLGSVPGLAILFKTTLAAAESFAVAPPEEPPVCPDPANPSCPEPPDGDGDEDGDEPEVEEELTSATDEGPGAPDGPTARTSDDVLPFTGADLGLLALIGAAVMAAGLAGMALSDRRRRATEQR
jgi:hypothetical protein